MRNRVKISRSSRKADLIDSAEKQIYPKNMPSLEEAEGVPGSLQPIVNSHRSSVGSLDEAGSESSGGGIPSPAEKKVSSCSGASTSSGVSSVSSSPANNGPPMMSDQKSIDSALGLEQIAHQLGILSILDQSESSEENNLEAELTPIASSFLNGDHYQGSTTAGFMIPKSSYRSDSGASSGGEYSLEGSPPTFGHQEGFAYGGYVIGAHQQQYSGVGAGSGGSIPAGLAEYVEYPGAFNDGDMPLRLSNGVNVTENVPVPSSEHVAEIVGRQGCKIKALRAKTNTYIKTPVRGEEPSFVVTGRRTDVEAAKLEILNAADHFTQIRASRRHSQGGAPAPGHITAYVRVPYRVVGLVVGPKGATIKRIQQDTHTYIITPSRDREPVFEVTGLPDNVERARREIEMHIYMRTGNLPITNGYDASHHAAAAAAAAVQAGSYPGGEQGGQQSTVQAGSQGGGPEWNRFVSGGNFDFHLNGNDVQFNGEVPQIGNPVISKPSSFTFGLGADCAAGGHSGVSYERSYPTWSTGGLVSVEPSGKHSVLPVTPPNTPQAERGIIHG